MTHPYIYDRQYLTREIYRLSDSTVDSMISALQDIKKIHAEDTLQGKRIEIFVSNDRAGHPIAIRVDTFKYNTRLNPEKNKNVEENEEDD